jgi:LDH2 family malate/lactate/ureidoglycolate dehydrogenase
VTGVVQQAGDGVRVRPDLLVRTVREVFAAVGFAGDDADAIAAALVDADLRGVSSHGVLLVPMYLERLRSGGVTLARELAVVHDAGAVVVADAGHGMGQLSSALAVDLAVERAAAHGAGVVAVRRAHHFGAASRWALRAVEAGCVGIAMSNTTPLMPAPGGATRVVGNNPLAIAVPTEGVPLVLDMALSAVALGRIRLAAATGRPIPEGWATDADGAPTTDAAAAVLGMLLPAAAHKGFGLALMIDVLTGVLSGGGWGDRVRPLYREPGRFNDCAHLFVVIDPARLGGLAGFRARASALAAQVAASPTAPGVDRVHLPGEIEWARAEAQRDGVLLARETAEALVTAARSVGVAPADDLLQTHDPRSR